VHVVGAGDGAGDVHVCQEFGVVAGVVVDGDLDLDPDLDLDLDLDKVADVVGDVDLDLDKVADVVGDVVVVGDGDVVAESLKSQ
jgi:hypothetical protein